MEFNELLSFVDERVGLRSITKLSPAGGSNSKVFPPTYMGGVYAVEDRLIDNEKTKCVLLDSVASQANRMEEVLQEYLDREVIKIPVSVIDFADQKDLNIIGNRLTSLQAPHRIADALFRECELDGKSFRESDVGIMVTNATAHYATPLFEICPTALLFGMWDSTGPKGGMGNKFERAITSEITGINAVFGVGTGSRIDPLISTTEKQPIYTKKEGGYTLNEDEAKKDDKGNAIKFKKGKLSSINLGNVAPALIEYKEDAKGTNPLTGSSIQNKDIAARGATINYAEHTCVISFAALRKLHFPEEPHKQSTAKRDNAARVVLASLGLLASTKMISDGLDLRSGCVLINSEPVSWDLLGNEEEKFAIDNKNAQELLKESIENASKEGIQWRDDPLEMKPNASLLEMIKTSQDILSKQGTSSNED